MWRSALAIAIYRYRRRAGLGYHIRYFPAWKPVARRRVKNSSEIFAAKPVPINMPLKIKSLLSVLLLAAGCQQMPQVSVPTLPGLGPHKIDIQQGNVITQEMIDKLQPGMTRNQVRFILGTPLLVDPFRTDRWDYVYSMKKGGELVEQRQLKVFFADDKMVRVEGDAIDAKPAAVAVKPVQPVASAASAKTEAVAASAKPTAKPAPVEVGKPQLQIAPGPGEPAKPDEIKAAQTPAAPAPSVAATPAASEGMVAPPLDAPPMPRLEVKPEPAEPASPFAAAPEEAPARAPAGKPAEKAAEKPASQPGFFGRLFGRSPAQPEQRPAAPSAAPAQPAAPSAPAPIAQPAPTLQSQPSPVAQPQQPAVIDAPVPKPATPAAPAAAASAEKPVVKPAEKAVIAAPAQTPADKPAEKPVATQRGFFDRLRDAVANPAPPVRQGGERTAEPGSPPPPFFDPEPVPGKP
jgi:outer membrane protein assembly factor BamE